ncbi:MAG: hypothetical protein AAB425_14130 [Bdellovibrionota bacterium]
MRLKAKFGIAITFPSLLLLSACMGMQNHETAFDLLAEQGSVQAFVEGYIEYPGPAAAWSGPASLVVHLKAREGQWASVAVTPDFLGNKTPSESPQRAARKLANAISGLDGMLSTSKAREQLGFLAMALSAENQGSYTGCMYPIRARLIRSDGTILEKQGCRGFSTWSKMSSEFAEQWMAVRN